MQKKVLTEQALYYGDVAMPKDWDIDRDKLQNDILKSNVTDSPFPFSRTFDMLNTYMRDHINLDYGFTLVNKETWGNMYKPQETTIPLLHINPVDLQNSPDFVLLYGVLIEECNVTIHYDNNRKKWTPSWIPDGFLMSEFTIDTMPTSTIPVDHFIYTDGLATISIYVEKLNKQQPINAETTNFGGVNTYSTSTNGYQITAVGEVPKTTVQLIANSVKLSP